MAEAGPYDVNVIGDYNIGGDAWASRILLEEMGLRVVGNWSGDATLAEHRARAQGQAQSHPLLSVDELHLPAHGGEVRHPLDGIQFLRPVADRGVAAQDRQAFGPEIKAKAEAVIAKYRPMVDAVIAKYKPRLDGKTVMLYVGGLRPRHVINAYEDLGMEIVGTGYEFGHNDDYQRTGHYVKEGTLIYDDVTGYELGEVRREGPSRSRRLRHQGKVPGAEDGHPVPPDAFVGLFGPVPRLRRLRDFRPRHGPRDQQPRLGHVRRALGSRRPWPSPPSDRNAPKNGD